jgi:hypothetical protein
VGAAGNPRPRAATHSEGGRLAFCSDSTILPLHHGSPFIGGGTSSGPWCGSDDGMSLRPVALVERGSPVRTAEPQSSCVLGLSPTDLAPVVGRE